MTRPHRRLPPFADGGFVGNATLLSRLVSPILYNKSSKRKHGGLAKTKPHRHR
jgi:hypothetical protein